MAIFDPTQGFNAFAAGAQIGGNIRQRQTEAKLAPMIAAGDYKGAADYAGQRGDLQSAELYRTQYMEALKAASEEDRLKDKERRQGIARIAMGGRNVPEEYLPLYVQENAAKLKQYGIPDEQIAQWSVPGTLNYKALDDFVRDAMEFDQQVEAYLQQQQPEYGFQNVQGVGIVSTDTRTGRVALAYELPENVRAAAGSDNVQSVQVLEDGEIALVFRNGTIQRTGERARNPYQITNIGDVPYAVDRITGGSRPISSPEEVGGSKATVNTVVANEEARRAAQQELPKVISTADRSINTLTQLRDHPALKFRYGLASIGGARPVIPGTPEAEVQALINQAGGQAFLQAFESLKGGGQITQIEGQRATDAITRLGNQNLDPADAVEAINELIAIAEGAKKRAQAQSGGTYEAPSATAPTRLRYNAETGEFE